MNAPQVVARDGSLAARRAMYSNNKLQIGLFGANCSSGRAVTLVPERWSGNWPDNKRLAQMSDDAGIDFLLPIGRWKGYGGDTDYQGTTLETITWATGASRARPSASRCSAPCTRRSSIRWSRPRKWSPPIMSSEGRFGLNIVVGWNEDEFDMFGVAQREHDDRYEYAQEWIDVIKMIWSDQEDFDFDGKYLHMKKIRGKPKPYGDTRPVIMNAGASATGQAFAIKNCDAFFLQASRTSLEETQTEGPCRADGGARAGPRDRLLHGGRRHLPADQERGRRVLPPLHRRASRLEVPSISSWAEEHLATDGADGGIPQAARRLRARHGRPADRRRSRSCRGADCRSEQGGPDRYRLSLVNYINELPYFCDEVIGRLERMGLREKPRA